MREIRLSGSEGGVAFGLSLPLLFKSHPVHLEMRGNCSSLWAESPVAQSAGLSARNMPLDFKRTRSGLIQIGCLLEFSEILVRLEQLRDGIFLKIAGEKTG
jgi:hypothetical protein